MLEKVTQKASMPLPQTVHRLLVVSAVLSTTAFGLSMSHSLGSDSLWTVPLAWILTIAHHTTLYVLSRRRSGPPPLPPMDETSPIKNLSRSSVYHPAAKTSSETAFSAGSEHPEQDDVDGHSAPARSMDMASFSERDTPEFTSKYPGFTRSTANCVATCVLAIIWTVGAVLPIRNHVVDMSTAVYFIRNMFPIPEAGIIWALFALFVKARRTPTRDGEFMRMD